jgi:1,4-dihydroxy-2-naphthoate octaprenyltransferase
MVMGTYYVLVQQIWWKLFWLSVPFGLLTIAILHGNNFRDIEEDLRAGYKTIAGFLGLRGSSIYYLVLVVGAYALTILFVALGWLPIWSLLILVTVPYAWRNIRTAFQPARVAFTLLDLLTAQLHMLFGLALLAGILLSRWVQF